MLLAKSSLSSLVPSQTSLMPCTSGKQLLSGHPFHFDSAQSLLKGPICSQADTPHSSKCLWTPLLPRTTCENNLFFNESTEKMGGSQSSEKQDRPLLIHIMALQVYQQGSSVHSKRTNLSFLCANSNFKKKKISLETYGNLRKRNTKEPDILGTTNKKLLKS